MLEDRFTKKQLDVLDQMVTNDKWTLMINYGAKRSGKTYVDNFLFLMLVRHAAKLAKRDHVRIPQFILAGYDMASIYSNIILELTNTFGIDIQMTQHSSFKMQFNGLPAVHIRLAYTGNKNGLRNITGMTSYGAYINEAVMCKNEKIFQDIRDRCSRAGAKVICDTNPDVPTHWLKKDYIDQAAKSKRFLVNHFIFSDNKANLDSNYYHSTLETTPSGMLYDRNILGQWVSGNGLVYQDFNAKKNVVNDAQFANKIKHKTLSYIAGVDWGFEHKGVLVVLAYDGDNFYLINVHAKRHKQFSYWKQLAHKMQQQYGYNMPFYCDSARPEYVNGFQDANIHAFNAYKNIMYGVENIASLIKSHKFFVLKSCAKQFEEELYKYVWNERTGKPLKDNNGGSKDDIMDSVRYPIATFLHDQENNKNNDYNKSDALLAEHGLADLNGNAPWGV